ncbi:MAG: AAA family ATPase [Acidimicrobiales bacterium]
MTPSWPSGGFSEVGELQLKGKSEPVTAWRALRVVAQRRGVGRSEALEAPFVGRAEELRLMKDLLAATEREHRARLLSVTGVPGIGKTRLVWEFAKYTDGLVEPVHWHEGRSPAYGDGITFWALGEMVRMRAGIGESEEPGSSRAKLSACVAEFVADERDRRWVGASLAHLLGIGEAPPGDRNELFSAWRSFFEAVADTATTVMVFEDLQWADAGLIDFVESILEWSSNHPILVVTLARPELLDSRPAWGAGQHSFAALHLEPLSETEMGDLLHGLVEGVPDEVVEAVRARSEGVPLYGVETVRMLVDRGVLVREDGSYRLVGELGSLQIPDTLHALVAARLDALSPEERSLLQDAAVVGRTFPTEALAALHGGETAASLEPELRDLVRKEFLYLETAPRSPQRGQHGFVQGITAEVAAATLARHDRSAKHLAVARHLESLGDEELTGLVAAHYVEAQRAAPETEATEIAVGAREWLSRAGKRALSLGSPEQALAFFEQALEMTPAGPEHALLLEAAGEAGGRAMAYEKAMARLEEAIAYYDAAGDHDAAGRATAALARALGGLDRYSEAIERVERAFEALGDEGEERVRAGLACELTVAHANSGSPARALEWSETALVLAEQLDDIALVAQTIVSKSYALYNLGRHLEAVILARGHVALAEAAGSLRDLALAQSLLGLLVFEENPRESLFAPMEAADLARRAGDRLLEMWKLGDTAEGSLFLGDWGRARTAIAELEEREPTSVRRVTLPIRKAMLAALTGESATAAAALKEAGEQVAASSEFLAARTTYLVDRSLVSLAAGDLDAAQREAGDAVALEPAGTNSRHALAIRARACLWLRDTVGVQEALLAMRPFRGRWMTAERLTMEAGLAALEGRVQEAAETYRKAVEAWRALDCTLDLALCELDRVLLLGPDHPDATMAKEARDIFTELGAKPFLERLNHAARLEQVPD